MAYRPVSLPQVLAGFGDVYSPRTVGRLNDYDLRVAHAKGERGWHSHDHTDEFFYVIDGRFDITLHQVHDQIAAAVSIPFPHIADPAGAAVRAAGLSRVGLPGTRFTMERGFCRDRLEATRHLKVLVPAQAGRALVHRVIYGELVQGVISDASRRHYLEIIGRLTGQGAEGIIAGCTEIELLVTGDDAALPYFPTTRLHAKAAADLALTRHAD